MRFARMVMFALVIYCLFIAGCSKLNRDNYDKVKVGMDYDQVVAIIGAPDKCDAALGAKNCVWGSEKKNITIKFLADKVAIPTMKGL